jgi:hypothetical protein
MRTPADPALWSQVQRIVYPHRMPSEHPPFARRACCVHRRIASWLYYKLLDNSALRAKVIA